MKIYLNSLMSLTIILICSFGASVQGSVIINSCGKYYEDAKAEQLVLSEIRQKLAENPEEYNLIYKLMPWPTTKFAISSDLFMNLVRNRSALLEIDGFELTINENSEGYKAQSAQSRVIKISTTDLIAQLDWRELANETIESALIKMYRLNKNTAVTSVTAYREYNPSRIVFEQLKIINNPASLPEGHPVYIKYTDHFNLVANRSRSSSIKKVSYEKGRMFKIGDESWIVLTSGKVVRLNRAIFEIRDSNVREYNQSLTSLGDLLKNAYNNYGFLWGHNVNYAKHNGEGGHQKVIKGPTPEYKVGIGMPVEMINSLKELVLRNNPYELTGIVILFESPTTGEIRLATYSHAEIGPQIFQKEGFNLPGIGLVPYTNIIGATGRAGDSYGQFRATLAR